MADAVRLRQVLVNLGGNAVKFTEQGEVTLRLRATRPRGRFACACGSTWRTPASASSRATNRGSSRSSRQEDASTTRRFGGTGLGLSIVRQLVELMGGQLSLTSAPGVGSTFSFELALPLALATAADAVSRRRSCAGCACSSRQATHPLRS